MLKNIYSLIALLLLVSLVSCSNDMEDAISVDNGTNNCRMLFNVTMSSYSDEVKSRASVAINDGTTLYVYFNAGGKMICGTATYHSNVKEWSISFADKLDNNGVCSLYYFPGAFAVNDKVQLGTSSVVYSTQEGKYTYDSKNHTITIEANLTPLLSRVALRGTAGTQFSLSGIKRPVSFDITTGKLLTTSEPLSVTIASTESFIYYLEPSASYLVVSNSTRTFTIRNPFKAGGISQYINIPTVSVYFGWNKLNNCKAVDLGLSVKWADRNVGANTVEQIGGYYAWGDVDELNSTEEWKGYKWCNGTSNSITKYSKNSGWGVDDGKTVLDPEDDVAFNLLGGNWRMPTQAEMFELNRDCNWELTSQNGVKGYKIKSKKNSNSIFLPCAGYSAVGKVFDLDNCYYWSSTVHYATSCSAYYQAGFKNSDFYYRFYGMNVRAVCK